MGDIFLSYAREDISVAENLAKKFEAQGWSVWWDRTIPPGKTWRDVIGEALNKAKCVVVLWSEHSVKSNWVITEADFGLNRNILIPVFIETIDPPLGFGNIQAGNLIGWEPKEEHYGLENLFEAIKEFFKPSADNSDIKKPQEQKAKEKTFSKDEIKKAKETDTSESLSNTSEKKNNIDGFRKIDRRFDKKPNKKWLYGFGASLIIVLILSTTVLYNAGVFRHSSKKATIDNEKPKSVISSTKIDAQKVSAPKLSSIGRSFLGTSDSRTKLLEETFLLNKINEAKKYKSMFDEIESESDFNEKKLDFENKFLTEFSLIQTAYSEATFHDDNKLTEKQIMLYKQLTLEVASVQSSILHQKQMIAVRKIR